ncbi:hypothetical protein J6590_083278 [Homalodisca vitripennis]|nr:hypothetical protein J6590_083278 [Homalodisca vitripennis]
MLAARRALSTDAPGNELYRRTDRITGETDVLEIISNVGSQTSTEYGRPGRALSTDAPGNELYRRTDRITGETDVLEIISNVGSQTSTEYGRPGNEYTGEQTGLRVKLTSWR